jgi:thiamine biosynthesis lipoprotein
VDRDVGVVRRPPGVRIDTGGSGKGLAADAVAHGLRGYSRFVVDCGGDVRVGGPATEAEPYEVEVEHPMSRECSHLLRLGPCGVATSGIAGRLWEAGGGYAHHVLDPSSGRSAWTGLIAVTALAPTVLEAETVAKAALLSGPDGGRRLLGSRGGLMVLEDGEVELAGPLSGSPAVRVGLPLGSAA